MSDLLIRGMEMPKSCLDCFACHVLKDEGLYCEPLDTDLEPGPFGRLANCPLVPVPPHGRLIDADALLQSHSVSDGIYFSDAYIPATAIKAAPTIIPAEEGK